MGPIQEYACLVLECNLNPGSHSITMERYNYPHQHPEAHYGFFRGSDEVFGGFWERKCTFNERLMCLAMLYTLAEDQGV
jgi:hypothetical protein